MWVAFVTGLVLGTITGITIMGMVTVARRADDDLDNLKYRRAGRRFLRRYSSDNKFPLVERVDV